MVLKFVIVVVLMVLCSTAYGAGSFYDEFDPTFGDHRVQISGPGNRDLSLTLDQYSGSGFRSKKEYLYGRIDMQMKLIAGDSAGTVTTFYVSNFCMLLCLIFFIVHIWEDSGSKYIIVPNYTLTIQNDKNIIPDQYFVI